MQRILFLAAQPSQLALDACTALLFFFFFFSLARRLVTFWQPAARLPPASLLLLSISLCLPTYYILFPLSSSLSFSRAASFLLFFAAVTPAYSFISRPPFSFNHPHPSSQMPESESLVLGLRSRVWAWVWAYLH